MVCKILFFDHKDSEKSFFDKNPLKNFCIKFINQSLNSASVKNLSSDDFEDTVAISIGVNSRITPDIIERFKNLRVIATRTRDYRHIDLLSCLDRNIAVVNVEAYKPDCEYQNLKSTFKSITGVLCGEKEHRVI